MIRKIVRNVYLNVFGRFKKPKPGIHILNSHFVTPNYISKFDEYIFEEFIQRILKYAEIISLQEAVDLIDKMQFDNKIYVALTFDDGFEECYSIIAPIIEKYGSKGAFFINANYIESDVAYQIKFNERTNTFTKKPMNWSQVKELHNRGHLIGSHNLDHTDFGELCELDLDYQLKENKRILENQLNYNCEFFAWTYGSMSNFSEMALRKSLKYHKYIFSSANFKNYYSMNKKVYNRRHVEPFWNYEHVNYFLSFYKE